MCTASYPCSLLVCGGVYACISGKLIKSREHHHGGWQDSGNTRTSLGLSTAPQVRGRHELEVRRSTFLSHRGRNRVVELCVLLRRPVMLEVDLVEHLPMSNLIVVSGLMPLAVFVLETTFACTNSADNCRRSIRKLLHRNRISRFVPLDVIKNLIWDRQDR